MPNAVPKLTYSVAGAGVHVDLDRLVASRMLLQANSGGGKSRAIRQLLEETHGRIQHLVLDPEGEFATLRERFDYVLAAPRDGDVLAQPKTARLLCRRLMELTASAVIDIYELKLDERREFVKLFLAELMALPRSLWHPTIVVIDEAHVFAPQAGESQALEMVTTLCTQGRKRGFCPILATQRISKLHKDAAAELLNKLIGRTGLDIDVVRAGDELGFTKDQRAQLKQLSPGTFFAYGPAIGNDVRLVLTGDVVTSHPEAGSVSAAPPPASARVRKLLEQELRDLPQQAAEEARSMEDLRKKNAELERQLRKAEKGIAPAPAIERRVVDQAAIETAVSRALVTHDREFAQWNARRGKTLIGIATSLEKGGALITQSAIDLRQMVELSPPASNGNGHAKPSGIRVESNPIPDRRPLPKPVGRAAAPADPDARAELPRPQQRILDALASFEALGIDAGEKGNVAVFSEASPRSSAFSNNLGALRSAGLIDYPSGGMVALTESGRSIASAESIATHEDLLAAWERKLPRPQWRILQTLISAYPESVGREQLADAAEASASSSAYANNLGALRSLGLIAYRPGKQVVATDLLYPPGLA